MALPCVFLEGLHFLLNFKEKPDHFLNHVWNSCIIFHYVWFCLDFTFTFSIGLKVTIKQVDYPSVFNIICLWFLGVLTYCCKLKWSVHWFLSIRKMRPKMDYVNSSTREIVRFNNARIFYGSLYFCMYILFIYIKYYICVYKCMYGFKA
jgi:hypothetical protein